MSAYDLWIPGRPKTKDRPRFGGRRRVYTPQATLDAEAYIRASWENAGYPSLEGPVSVSADLYPDGIQLRVEQVDWTSKLTGDTDNYLKTILDGLQPNPKDDPDHYGAFANDKQVVRVYVDKR